MLSKEPPLSVVSALIVGMFAVAPQLALAVTLTVTDLGDSGALGQLRTLINQAASGDTIVIGAGTIALTGAAGEDANVSGDLDIVESLTIQGAGQGVTIIEGGGIDRVIDVRPGAGSVNLSNVTIRNGVASDGDGGAIRNSGTLTVTNSTLTGNKVTGFNGDGGAIRNSGTLTVTNSTLSGNTASGDGGDGGAIENSGTLTVTNSTLTGNTVTFFNGDGGAIHNLAGGTVTVTNSTLSSNTASDGDGGAIENLGTLTVTNSTLSGNTASGVGDGGAIRNGTGGTLTVTNSTLIGNKVTSFNGDGGAIHNFEGTATITNSTLSSNTASDGDGGAIENLGTLTVTNSTLSLNTASGVGDGGAIRNGTGGTLTVTNSTLIGNSAAGPFGGGGIRNFGVGSTVTLTNVTLWGNRATGGNFGGGGISNDGGGNVTLINVTISSNTATAAFSSSGGGIENSGSGSTVTLTNTLVSFNSSDPFGNTASNCGTFLGATITSLGHNLDSGTTCAFAGPGDISNTNPLQGLLQDNGGPTLTSALLPGSPAIDAGTNVGCPLLDQRGFVRPVATCDIGAYELGPAIAAALAASLLPTGRSVQVGAPATAFATILNGGPGTALGCRLAPVPPLPATFAYQTTDSLTNALTGTPNTPANIPAGGGQSFVFALTPTSPIAPTDVLLSFACTNAAPAPTFVGVSTLFLVASATPVPDPVALAATIGNTGFVTLASVGAFAVATVNVGASALLTVTPDTGGASLPLTLSICQTDAGANCLAPPAPSVTTQINAAATPTFSIFALGTGPIPFLPGTNRIFVRFTDNGSIVRGATSVAVCSVPLCP